jgi:hypothetical protein
VNEIAMGQAEMVHLDEIAAILCDRRRFALQVTLRHLGLIACRSPIAPI